MIFLLACAAETEAPSQAQPAAPTAPDIVLVGVAGLRGDQRAGAAKSFAGTLPGTQTLFTEAYAQSTTAFTSWGSVLTGRAPSAVPLCGVVIGAPPPWCNTIPAATPTLPQVLGLYGYRTALVHTGLPHPETFTTTFDTTIVTQTTGEVTDWAALTQATTAWWNTEDPRPRLLVVAVDDLMVQSRPALLAQMGLDRVAEGGMLDHNRIHGSYREAAVQTGRNIGALYGALRGDRPRWTFTFGVHGMNLADGGGAWQALRPDQPWNDIVIERTTHVPLVVGGPGMGGQDGRIVELVDVMPTVTALAGAVVPANATGRSLLDRTPEAEPTAYAEFGDMLGVRRGDLYYVIRAFFHNRASLDPELTNFLLDTRLDPDKHYLYDLRQDPSTAQNIITTRPAEAQAMHELLRTLRTGPGAPPPGQLTARRVWELRLTPSQGYW